MLRMWNRLFAPEDGESAGTAADTSALATDEAASALLAGASDGNEKPDTIKEVKPVVEGEMAAAISAGLKPKTDTPAADDKKAAATAEPDKAAATPKEKEKPAETAKVKKADDFALTDEEKKAMHPKSQNRWTELTGTLKAKEKETETLTVQVQALTHARNDIMSLLTETKTEPQDLGQLLDYNLMIKSGRFEDALKVVETQRAQLLKALGREAPGVDLLDEFPDLKSRVDAQEIARQDALELANTRRREAAQRQSQGAEQQRQQQNQSRVSAENKALDDIEKWTGEMSKTDLDYKKKEERIVPQIAEIMKDYPTHLWLTTFKRLYNSISVVKEPPTLRPGNGALRPSGTSPGGQQPNDMAQAIKQGLRMTG